MPFQGGICAYCPQKKTLHSVTPDTVQNSQLPVFFIRDAHDTVQNLQLPLKQRTAATAAIFGPRQPLVLILIW